MPDETGRKMLLIKCIDNDAVLMFSEYTSQWYVSTRIDEGGDGVLRGITEHADTPQEAVAAYFRALTEVPLDKYLVMGAYGDDRKHWRWNGAGFHQLPVSVSHAG